MKRGQQGWRRLDNTAKIFPVIANENFSNVFRVAVTLKEEINPDLLQQALEDVMPCMDGFRVKLRRGFFWYYFESNKRTPLIEKEAEYPCKYIDPHSNQLFLFRVSYYKRRINLEMFHAMTDGLGAMNFLRQLTYRYLQLSHHLGGEQCERGMDFRMGIKEVEDSYLENYRKMKNESYSSKTAYRLSGEKLPLDAENIVHGYVKLEPLKKLCKEQGVSITKYLTACMIFSVYQVYLEGCPCEQPVGINLPINLRTMFGSETMANFFAVVGIDFEAVAQSHSFEEILGLVGSQMDEKIVKEKLEERISYNVSNEKKWYVRVLPLFIKWAGMNLIFRLNDRAHTLTLSNLGPITVEPEYSPYIEQFYAILGVSDRQPVKCVICSYGDELVVSFASIFADLRLQDYFFGFLKAHGVPVEITGNGVAMEINKEDIRECAGEGNFGDPRQAENSDKTVCPGSLGNPVQAEKSGKPAQPGKSGDPASALSNRHMFAYTNRDEYPDIQYDPVKWKKLVNIFYLVLAALGAILAVVNYAVGTKVLWSGIAVACIAYTALTVRYSITRHANLGSKIMIQTIGAQVVLIITDHLLGYSGWSVNYAVPSTILFADLSIVFLIIVNRLNWQSYLMYQITMTIFSFIPIALWAFGWITRPEMAIITVILTVLILTLVVLMGDRSVKRELIRRFHL